MAKTKKVNGTEGTVPESIIPEPINVTSETIDPPQVIEVHEDKQGAEKPTQEEKATDSSGQQAEDPSKKQEPVLHFMPIDEMILLKDQTPPTPKIWSGIKAGSFGYVFGPSKSGKTTICENLGLSIAAGFTSFLGLPVDTKQQKVLFISLEEYWVYRTERNKKQIALIKDGAPAGFEKYYLTVKEEFPRLIFFDKDWEEMRDTIIKSESKIVFIDSLTRMNFESIEESKNAVAISIKLRELSAKLNITLIVIHHTHKQYGNPITIDSLAGSRVLAQEADFLIGINRGTAGSRYYKEVAFRYERENDETVIPFTMDDSCWVVPQTPIKENALLYDPGSDGRKDETNQKIVEDTIREKVDATNPTITTADLKLALVDTGLMTNPTLHSSIGKLIGADIIVKEAKGVYKLK